jgi:hypothetical protein
MPCLARLSVCVLGVFAITELPAQPAAGPTIVMPGAATAAPQGAAPGQAAPRSIAAPGCLPSGNGYLRARVRGALNLDIDWSNAQIECDGGPRSDGSGIRMSFVGPQRADGRRLRMVFGVNAVHEGRSGRALPTNLTVIVEGGQRLYATRGEDRCTVDSLRQQRLTDAGAKARSYRIVARGFCVAPASTLNETEHILVSRFDFAGTAIFGVEAQEDAQPQLSPSQASGGLGVRK